jgi:hypothetical protein
METTIPPFILERMLLPGCARILSDGRFCLRIKNAIAPLKIVRHHDDQYKSQISIKIDDNTFAIEDFIVSYQGIRTPYSNLDPLDGFIVNVDDEAEIIYNGKIKLKPGVHIVDISVNTTNPIRIKFSTNFRESFL